MSHKPHPTQLNCPPIRRNSYNTIKTWIQGDNKTMPLGPSMHMLAAAQAGVLTLVMTNPIWVVKTRLCLQYDGPKDVPVLKDSINRYRGMVDGLTKIYKYEGVRGLYKVKRCAVVVCLCMRFGCNG